MYFLNSQNDRWAKSSEKLSICVDFMTGFFFLSFFFFVQLFFFNKFLSKKTLFQKKQVPLHSLLGGEYSAFSIKARTVPAFSKRSSKMSYFPTLLTEKLDCSFCPFAKTQAPSFWPRLRIITQKKVYISHDSSRPRAKHWKEWSGGMGRQGKWEVWPLLLRSIFSNWEIRSIVN